MTRKLKYHRDLNKFEELPGMEEPNIDDEVDENVEGTYKERCIWYVQHIEDLRDGVHNPMIDGSPKCRKVFEDGQVVEEGKDVNIWIIGGVYPCAMPLRDNMAEDELWQILIYEIQELDDSVHITEVVEGLKARYSLTRKP